MYDCKYSLDMGYQNNWSIINSLYDITDYVGYECNNKNIIDVNDYENIFDHFQRKLCCY